MDKLFRGCLEQGNPCKTIPQAFIQRLGNIGTGLAKDLCRAVEQTELTA
jgi:hypothetical protein